MWNVEKWCRSTCLQGMNRDADPETGHVDMMGQAVGQDGLWDWHIYPTVWGRRPVGTCCIVQGAQLRALWWSRWVGWRSKRVGIYVKVQFSSVQSLSPVLLFATPWTAARQASCPSSTPRAYSNSYLLNQWCHPTISSSVAPFSFHLQSFPASGSFPMSQFFLSGAQSIGVSASASVLPINTQDWSPLGWTGWISSQCKGLSRVFSNTTVQKHQCFSVQLSL